MTTPKSTNHPEATQARPALRFELVLGTFAGVVVLVYVLAYLALKLLGFDYGSAIFDVAPLFGGLMASWKCAKSYRFTLTNTDYWILIVGCLIIETGISILVIYEFNSRVLEMHLTMLPIRLGLHLPVLMYLYSDKRITKQIASLVPVHKK